MVSKLGKALKLLVAGFAVVGVSTAAKSLIEYDRSNGWKGGAITFGAALALGLLFGSFKGTRGYAGPIVAVGGALGGLEAIGGSAENLGEKVAGWFRGMSTTPGPKGPVGGSLPNGPAGLPAPAPAPLASQVAPPAPAPVVIKQAPVNPLLTLGTEVIKGGFSLLSSYVGKTGSAGVEEAEAAAALDALHG